MILTFIVDHMRIADFTKYQRGQLSLGVLPEQVQLRLPCSESRIVVPQPVRQWLFQHLIIAGRTLHTLIRQSDD